MPKPTKTEQAANAARGARPARIDTSPGATNLLTARTAESLRDMLRAADQETERIARDLKDDLGYLIRTLSRLEASLAKDGPNTSVNGLGEIQRQGPEIDRKCAQLDYAQKHRAVLQRVVMEAGL